KEAFDRLCGCRSLCLVLWGICLHREIQVRFSSHHTRPREIHHKDTEDTKVSFGVTRGQRLRRRCKYISPSATAANNAKFPNASPSNSPSNRSSSPLQIFVLSAPLC